MRVRRDPLRGTAATASVAASPPGGAVGTPRTGFPADVLYGRLLASAAQHVRGGGPPARARIRSADGSLEPLLLDRWVGIADAVDTELLAHAEPAVLDLGCGPGRHLAALRASGKPGLGVDLSPVAVRLARRRGAAAIPGDVFGDVPWAGHWRTALLLDGNVGIGGAPEALLRRTRELLAPGGAALVEVDPPGMPTVRTRLRIEAGGAVSEWFRWARVGVDGIDELGARAGLPVQDVFSAGDRWLARLQRHETAGTVPAQVLEVAAARAVADGGDRLDPARSRRDRGGHRLSLAHGLRARSARQRDRAGGRGPSADLRLAGGPSWLYAVNQSLHVNVGLVAVPLLLAKLWSVIPRLFAWPPVSSPAQAIERLGIALLVASAIFQFATGIVNVQYWYAFHFNFVVAHYYGAVVFVGALFLHVLVKTPVILGAYRERGWLRPLRDDLRHTRPERADPHGGLAPANPDPPTLSRRGLFAFVGGASLTLLVANVGESIGGPLRPLAFLAPRRESFPVNKTAAKAGITDAMVGPAYLLTLSDGAREIPLTLDELQAMPQHTARLPIACVEGWTTTQTWTGVRLADLAAAAGVAGAQTAFVRSLQPAGVLSKASLSGDAIHNADSLLALKVNGADLPLDHGYPARIIVPALPGVHNTRWVGSIEFA